MKKSVIIAFFVLIVALILILAIICGKALFAKNLIVNTYQSNNFGINCATDGNKIYYIQTDGIYQATMDMKESKCIIKDRGITFLAIDGDKMVYSKNGIKKQNSSGYSQIIKVLLLSNIQSPIYDMEFLNADYFYLENDMLYIYGIHNDIQRQNENGTMERGLYIYNLKKGNDVMFVTEDMCYKNFSFDNLLLYCDENICWFYNPVVYASTKEDNLYALNSKKLVTGLWDTNTAYLKPLNKCVLMIEKNVLKIISSSGVEKSVSLLPNNNSNSTGEPKFTGWIELSNNDMVFFAQEYKYRNSTLGKPKLKDHLYDIIFLVNSNLEIIKIFQTVPEEKILYADDEVVISLLENEIYEINYLESDVRIPVGKIPNYLGEITVNVCGSNLLFFKNGEMFQTVEINN